MSQEKQLKDLIRGHDLVEAPTKTERFGKHYEFIIGIGNDETATIILSDDALKALSDITEDYKD